MSAKAELAGGLAGGECSGDASKRVTSCPRRLCDARRHWVATKTPPPAGLVIPKRGPDSGPETGTTDVCFHSGVDHFPPPVFFDFLGCRTAFGTQPDVVWAPNK